MKKRLWGLFGGALAALSVGLAPARALACGGFFCSSAQPVNQDAERIIFADNGDGTVTAVIQIQYQGPSESFSWLLPVATAPTKLELSSDLAFSLLQAATNPLYSLTTTVEGECESEGGRSTSLEASSDSSNDSKGIHSVNVTASGQVGPFAWVVISVAEDIDDPAAEAVEWLESNEYDVPAGARSLLSPYLQDGLSLLALRLTKDANVGSIRPIVLTYEASRPIIPVKLTAVAANDDMGVLVWLLGAARGVPENYLSLELNEARLNWFNPVSNYNALVIEAANDAGGQGFVTELAGPTSRLKDVIWGQLSEQSWLAAQGTSQGSFFDAAYSLLSQDPQGFWDAFEASTTLPADTDLEQLKECLDCAKQYQFDQATFVEALELQIVQPLRDAQALIDAHPQITRLYTTLSAAEMTLDPLFTFNGDLPDVSNQHVATRVIECTSEVTNAEASWRIELPQGDVVRGTARQAQTGGWAPQLDALPPNLSIRRLSASGEGKQLENNDQKIKTALDDYNASVPRSPEGCGCALIGAPPANRRAASPTHERSNTDWAWVGLGSSALCVYLRRRRVGAN